MASVTIRSAVKRFGEVEVLHGVDIDIADGEFTVLVGPSGCGKSTLLRMIAGLEDISGGDDRDRRARVVNDVPPKERDIAMVFQNYALYPHMTVRDNMAFALDARASSAEDEIDERVGAAAEHPAASTQLLDRYPRQLSGGQRQRVAMGRAIVRDPQVFLFDEPLSNLDAKLRVADAHRDQGAAPAAADHHRLRHPRPDRGDDDGRPDRRDEGRPRRAGRQRRSSSTTSRPTSSSPASSARRR
jgi:multiple sugar transport system ATP-binding protein